MSQRLISHCRQEERAKRKKWLFSQQAGVWSSTWLPSFAKRALHAFIYNSIFFTMRPERNACSSINLRVKICMKIELHGPPKQFRVHLLRMLFVLLYKQTAGMQRQLNWFSARYCVCHTEVRMCMYSRASVRSATIENFLFRRILKTTFDSRKINYYLIHNIFSGSTVVAINISADPSTDNTRKLLRWQNDESVTRPVGSVPKLFAQCHRIDLRIWATEEYI